MKAFSSSLTLQIFLAMACGCIVGLYFGPNAAFLGSAGKLFVALIKGAATPLVFFGVLEAILETEIKPRNIKKFFFVILVNSLIAGAIGLGLTDLFKPGELLQGFAQEPMERSALLDAVAGQKLTVEALIGNLLPQNIIDPFLSGNIAAVVVLAILIGCALRTVSRHYDQFSLPTQSAALGFKVFEQIIRWLVRLVPLAVFGVIAQTVGTHGFGPFRGLALYVLLAGVGMAVQVVVVYQFWIVRSKVRLTEFWSAAKEPIVYSFGTNSSLATLPLTLVALEKLKVSHGASRLGACIGTNLNNDGILLYQAVAIIFLAQMHNLDLTILQQIVVALLCIVSSAGVAGVPEAGIVSLSLVLATLGLPIDTLPLLLTVDWLVARFRSVTNVLSDMTVSIAIDDPRPK